MLYCIRFGCQLWDTINTGKTIHLGFLVWGRCHSTSHTSEEWIIDLFQVFFKMQSVKRRKKKQLSKCTVSHFRMRSSAEWLQYFNLLYLQSVSKVLLPFLLKSLFNKMSYFFVFKIFDCLIVKQIEAFQRSGIQLENGNLERSFIMWCSLDHNLHQLEFH